MPTWIINLWPYRKLITYFALSLIFFFGGYQFRLRIDEADSAIRLEAEAVAQKKAQAEADAKAAAWEKQLLDLRTANTKLNRRLHAETKKAVYSSCVVPDDGVRIYNDALSGNGAGGSNGKLP